MEFWRFLLQIERDSSSLGIRAACCVWLVATGFSWLLMFRGLAASVWGHRRLVSALRWVTQSAVVNLFGLFVMVLIANPARWNTNAWILTVAPIGGWFLAVGVAASRPGPISDEVSTT